MKKNSETIKNSILHNLNEIGNARMYLAALLGAGKANIENTSLFLKLASNALTNDMFTLVLRVLDKHKGSASFFYLLRVEGPLLEVISQEENIDISTIESVADRLCHPRDKAHAHIDKKYAYQSEVAWQEAGVSTREIQLLLNNLYTLLSKLFEKFTEQKFDMPDYDEEDARQAVILLNSVLKES